PEDARDRQLRTYSRGMLQRTGIAAAILHRPRLVVLDEPLNGLDPLGRRDFRDLILSLKDEGTAVFLSSHVLGDIENTADRVGILDQGRLIRCGSLHDILSADGRRIEIAFEFAGEIPLPLRQRIGSLRPHSTGWIGEVDDVARASAVAHDIVAAGGRIIRYDRQRVSLEEFFMSQVEPDGAHAHEAAGRPESAGAVRRPGTAREGVTP
ncbi:MAG: ABC transporter ATP-binding protein, partial [Gemmatimonadetes bacterium]|nr:ABC transporter ATP-binding protein [Gemmatimonadota bacterium]